MKNKTNKTIKIKKFTFYILILLMMFGTGLFSSCEKETEPYIINNSLQSIDCEFEIMAASNYLYCNICINYWVNCTNLISAGIKNDTININYYDAEKNDTIFIMFGNGQTIIPDSECVTTTIKYKYQNEIIEKEFKTYNINDSKDTIII